jgi:outer membrane protein TolC
LQALLARLGCPPGDRAEVAERRRQLQEYHAHRQREVAEDVRQAAQSVRAQMEVIALTRRRVDSWHARVQEVEEKKTKGVDSYAEVTEARLEWRRARRELVRETVNLQRAWVRLRQAQGVLPLLCGPTPGLPQAAAGDGGLSPADPEGP